MTWSLAVYSKLAAKGETIELFNEKHPGPKNPAKPAKAVKIHPMYLLLKSWR
ncbi:MAG: hypothetical protein SRB2_04247 [Desulfobacteraceae bacterium Eth-SRB2]|nr:MAG: hypothetical protein SRB2_04247 [Desulfobacteraceae bacterium Eth-SRB2]